MIHHPTKKKYVMNTSNINSIKVWSGNIGQKYSSNILNPSGVSIATIGGNVAESSGIIVDVSAYDYVRVVSSGTGNADIAYKIIN